MIYADEPRQRDQNAERIKAWREKKAYLEWTAYIRDPEPPKDALEAFLDWCCPKVRLLIRRARCR